MPESHETISPAASGGHVCAYPWQQMIIDLTGEVVPCCFWSGYANSGKPLGNTNVNTIEEIWNGPGYQALRQRIVEHNVEGFPCHGCIAKQWMFGKYPSFVWPSFITHDEGAAYKGRILQSFLDEAAALSDPWMLLEDGQSLGPADASQEDIQRLGGGRFAVVGEGLYLSASDNSSPTENGRTYELRRGAARWEIRTTRLDSLSGENLLTAHDEYQSHAVQLTAKPTILTFISTSDCNIDCGMCSQNKVRKHKVQHRPQTQQDVLALTPYLQQFTWQGGEPFLIDDFRTFYTEFQPADNPNLTFGFTSNGTMLSEKVVQQLLKFPRLNASISMDSFLPDSFERIRAGARFDVVLPNLLRVMAHYDLPDRIFQVGAVIMKSNILELPANIRIQHQHDLVMNIGPMVVYPCHERLDIFHDIARQTAGWDEAIGEARELAEAAFASERKPLRANNVAGMLGAIQDVINEARKRYARTAPLTVHVEDPSGSLANMRMPAIVFYRREMPSRPLGYVLLNGPGTYVVHAPEQEMNAYDQPYAHFYHDIHDETDIVGAARMKPIGRRRFADLTLQVPDYTPKPRVRNLRLSSGGRAKPDGLIIVDVARQL